MRRAYSRPFFLNANGIIELTASQAAVLGLGNIDEWNTWYTEWEDIIEDLFPNFDVLDSDTWPAGFEQSDPDTWGILIDEP